MRATFANIYIDNLRHNLFEIKRYLQPQVKICVPVKADAYGHGAVPVAKEAVAQGASYLAVAAVSEGIALRKAGISIPVLVLSLPQPSEFAEIIQFHLTPTVFDVELAGLLNRAAEKAGQMLPVHLKIDTGMGRIGCNPFEAVHIAEYIADSSYLHLEGVFTHLAVSDSLTESDRKYTVQQLALFTEAIESIKKAGIDPGIRHAANSAGVFCWPESHFDMVRPGLIVYGYYPGDITEEYLQKSGIPVHLKPVMEFCSTIVAIKKIKSGESVSYGRTWTATEDGHIGVLPVGYADGLLRNYGRDVKVSINGKDYSICGRICMDQCMVNLGRNSGVSRWDHVVIFGPKEESAVQTAADIALAADTIPYEVTCGIDKRVPRVYIDREKTSCST